MSEAPVQATPTNLATIEDLANYTQQDLDAINPTQADYYLRLATAQVVGYLGFDPTYVENDPIVVSPTGQKALAFLPVWPILSVSTVEVRDDNTGEWNDVTDSVDIDLATGIIAGLPYTGIWWPLRSGSWRITCTHGWQKVPDAVVAIAAQLAGEAYSTAAGIQSESIGGYSVRYQKGGVILDQMQSAALAPYRCPALA